MQESIRKQRKTERANKRDKWGFSMSLSRSQRRAFRKLMFSQCYITRTGVIRLDCKSSVVKDNPGSSDHLLYGGGSMKSH